MDEARDKAEGDEAAGAGVSLRPGRISANLPRLDSIPVRDDDDGDDIRLPDGNTYDTTQVENEADRANGASSSPLYSWFDNGQMYAIGVHHGLEIDWIFPAGSEKYSAASGGAGLPALIKWARATWP